ncbi:hypothetical protein CBR_g48929 [Chara braunii]|uniref:Reverse transcriptase domain-containing protein n=1 Tax=Chara braunii TaxID=69332 RepID=A0A388M3V2_CHABU|nr:hypothetical protein CBR_g48929 [Chara braunii]|eukprot:GBG89221.1 hypothetical protein CBR_g48929 [Chara braunii]
MEVEEAEGGEGNRGLPPLPPPPTSFWEIEDKTRQSIGQCYDDGVMQLAANLGNVVIDERGKRFKVTASLDAIKERWLKERTVIFIFQDEARDLPRGVKEDLVRSYEDWWFARRLFHPEVRRGRIKFESPNVVSYVAKAVEVANWLIQKGTIVLSLRGKEYPALVKPWMPKLELKELKLREAETNFWIVALRVPLDAMLYLPSAVEGLIGVVKHTHPPEADRTEPKLMNIKLDMDAQARFRVEGDLDAQGSHEELGRDQLQRRLIGGLERGEGERQMALSSSSQSRIGMGSDLIGDDPQLVGSGFLQAETSESSTGSSGERLRSRGGEDSDTGPTAGTRTEMVEYARLYYSDILTSRRLDDTVDTDLSLESNMWEDTTVVLSEADCLSLDRPITVEELGQTLKQIAPGKCPGRDGLTVEFYRACWDALGPALVEVYNEILVGGKLGEMMTHGVISIMFKKGDKASIRNYRPISNLNVNYKILAKSLALQLGRILPKLVERDQGAFVQGRSIFINILTAIESIEEFQAENLNVVVLRLDMETAYDSVGWSFMLTTLRKMDLVKVSADGALLCIP